MSGHGYNRAPQTRRLGGLPNQTLSPVRHNLLTSLARNENKLFRIRSSRLHFVGHVIGPSWKGEVQSCFFIKPQWPGSKLKAQPGCYTPTDLSRPWSYTKASLWWFSIAGKVLWGSRVVSKISTVPIFILKIQQSFIQVYYWPHVILM